MELTNTGYLPSYTVGTEAYKAVPEVTRRFGKTAVVIGGQTAMEKALPRLKAALEGTGVEILDNICYGKQPLHARSAELAAMVVVKQADMVFGMGGGRAIDQTKEVADLADKPLFTFPTVASNCAPVTAIGVFYKEDGALDNYYFPPAPPIHCFIDTQVISESPDDYFWAGIGDALSKEPEVELSSRDLDLPHTPLMGRALAHACGRPLFDYGVKAMADKKARKSSYEIEQVILDIIISTGIVSNMTTNLNVTEGAYYFNSTTAHAFYNGYTGMGPEAEKHLHGEVVSFGVLCLYAFDNQPEMLVKAAAKNQELGLPITLAQIDCPESALDGIVERAQNTNEWGRAPYGFTPERFRQCILDADAYGQALLAGDEAAQAAALDAVRAHVCTEPTPRKA